MALKDNDAGDRPARARGRGVRTRDAAATREAILDAAEQLFAERGYAEASLEEIGTAAGVSRGTPNYFFGSKDGLYSAVLVRVSDVRESFLDEGFGRALAKLPVPPARPTRASLRSAIEEAVDVYCDFLTERPTFVQLMQREAVDGGRRLDAARTGAPAVHRMLTELLEQVSPTTASRRDIKQLQISFVALLMFPYSHADTLMKSLQLSPADARFIRERKRHVVDLLLCALSRGADHDGDGLKRRRSKAARG